MKKCLISTYFLLVCLLHNFSATTQNWRVHLNANETYPLFAENKGYYPILWYSSDDDRGVLVGGFGVGVAHHRSLVDDLSLKTQLNFQRSRFYDEPTIFSDFNGELLGGIIGVNTNYNATFFAMPYFPFSKNGKWLIGTGFGLQGTFSSKTDYGEAIVNGEKKSLNLKNQSLTPVVLFLPVEVTKYFGERFSVAIRGELGLTRVSRLDAYKDERNFMLVVEAGYTIQ